MPSFFFRELQLITVLFLICGSYIYELKHKIRLSKTACGTFDFVSFLLKFIFLFNKMHGFFDFKKS